MSEFAQLVEQVLALGDRAGLINLRPANHAFSIDEKCCAFVHAALVVEDAVGLANGTMGPVIREKRKRNAAELFCPRFETGHGVRTDLQDFDVQLLEFFEVRTEPADLVLSAACESERQKRNDGSASAIVRERDLLVAM